MKWIRLHKTRRVEGQAEEGTGSRAEELTSTQTQTSSTCISIDTVEFRQRQELEPTLKDLWNHAKTEDELYIISKGQCINDRKHSLRKMLEI